MALIKCRECGAAVSTQAKNCPSCGAPPRKKIGLLKWFFICWGGATLVTIVSAALSPSRNSTDSGTASPTQATSAPAKPEKNYAYALVAAKALKKSMRDPDSFKLESAYIIKDTGVVCFEYRSHNGFGGMSEGMAVLYKTGFVTNEQNASRFRVEWNKECAHKDGMEAEALINRYLGS